MTAEVKFEDGNWKSDPIIITAPEQEVLEANERYKVVEYTVKVSVLRCYYKNEEKDNKRMIFICSECGRKIDPDRVHWENGVPLPDGMGFELKEPKAMYNLCYDCICKLGEGKLKLKMLDK